MSLDLASEIWTELKRYIGSVDRSEAADVLVNLLVDHDHDADEIRSAFKGDSDVKQALQVYSDSEADDVDDDYEDEDDEY
jgi:hypothetical protein